MAALVRQPIDVQSLQNYLARQAPQIDLPLEVRQFGFGQSNPTYQLTSVRTRKRYVLRKKPTGELLSKAAHQVEREYRIIRALEQTDVPVPEAYCLCTDETVLGTPFYIMEFLNGRVFEDPAIFDVAADERAQLWKAATQTLAKLHQVDYVKVGLHDFGRSKEFYNRQLATWTQICGAQEKAKDADTGEAVGRMPHFHDLVCYFSRGTQQPLDRATLVHGDYKIDNLVFHPTEPRVIGILDWEMSTVGHPLSDLAGFLLPYYTAARLHAKYFHGDNFLATPGLPTPPVIIQWYRDVVTGWWDPQPDMEWAVAFAAFRSAAICQGIAARVATRQASSLQAHHYADAFRPFADFAWEFIRHKELGVGVDGGTAKIVTKL
ncbi:acyl-CoA dehydrogenase family member 11 [Apiospora kogelbergensis]|uniref:Acyl-CoA dehydrogenase family member 11 n=1 Tax=Apiospora kogelbergensis TaxID=1337665 RepID=A0AAW0Q9A6_9PEZI